MQYREKSQTRKSPRGEKLLTSILSFVTLVVLLNASAFSQTTVLGILEDVPGENPSAPHSRGVRIVFQKVGTQWEAFPSTAPEDNYLNALPSKYPHEVSWTIAFDGRALGELTGRTPGQFESASTVGMQTISSGDVPTVGERSAKYGGYTDAVVFRPLVAVSKSNFKDPDNWKPLTELFPGLAARLRAGFRSKYPHLCQENKKDQTKLQPFIYRDQDVKIVGVYISKASTYLGRLHLEGAIDCQDIDAGFEIDDPWFFMSSRGLTRYVDSGMWLVDAGDYDNDGKSEVVFSINRDNRGGYEIFYDDFRKHATFEFLYH
jgi:hypothetical protein